MVSHWKKRQEADDILKKKKNYDRRRFRSDLVLFAIAPAQAESLPPSLEQAMGGTGLYVISLKIVHMS